MRSTIKKLFIGLVVVAVVLPGVAHAEMNGFLKGYLWSLTFPITGGYGAYKSIQAGAETAAGQAVGSGVEIAVQGIAAILNSLSIAALQLGAFFAEVALGLSFNVINSPAVQTGFRALLGMANLAFVIGIVVIAVATILQNQTYGIKKSLSRLVIMAILVNFSLVLTGVVINFSDQVTKYFVEKSAPDFGKGWKFSTALMNGFQAQGFQATAGQETNQAIDEAGAATNVKYEGNVADEVVGNIIALIATIAFTSLAALAMWVLALTLFLRYIILSLLLIVMPIAWVAWIFQSTNPWFKKWWDKFIKWTFYAPAMMFFVYLALNLATSDFLEKAMVGTGESGSVAQGLGIWATGSSTLQSAIKSVVVIGLLFGGFMAASSMGMGLATSATNGVQNLGKKMWAGTKRGTRRAGGRMFGETLKKTGEKWQQAGANMGWIGRTFTAPVRGIGAQMTKGKDVLVGGTFKDYQEKIKGWSEERRINAIAASRGIEQVVLLESLKDSKKFGEAVKRAGENLEDKAVFERWGQGDVFKAARNKSGRSMLELANKRAGITGEDDEAKKMREELDKKDKDLNAKAVVNAMSADDLHMFFKDYEKGKEPLGDNFEKAALEAARNIALFGSVDKIRKIIEADDTTIRDNFVKLIEKNKIKWEEIEKENKAWATWLQSKGRERFEEDELGFEVPRKSRVEKDGGEAEKSKAQAGFVKQS